MGLRSVLHTFSLLIFEGIIFKMYHTKGKCVCYIQFFTSGLQNFRLKVCKTLRNPMWYMGYKGVNTNAPTMIQIQYFVTFSFVLYKKVRPKRNILNLYQTKSFV